MDIFTMFVCVGGLHHVMFGAGLVAPFAPNQPLLRTARRSDALALYDHDLDDLGTTLHATLLRNEPTF